MNGICKRGSLVVQDLFIRDSKQFSLAVIIEGRSKFNGLIFKSDRSVGLKDLKLESGNWLLMCIGQAFFSHSLGVKCEGSD